MVHGVDGKEGVRADDGNADRIGYAAEGGGRAACERHLAQEAGAAPGDIHG